MHRRWRFPSPVDSGLQIDRNGSRITSQAVKLRSGGGSAEGYVAELNLARVYAGLGDADRAFEQLEIAYSKREPWILALKVGPGFDTIRDDPRFVDLLRRIGVEP